MVLIVWGLFQRLFSVYFQTPAKAKGVSGLIEVENPNRVVKKNKKLSNLDNLGEGEKPQLSR